MWFIMNSLLTELICQPGSVEGSVNCCRSMDVSKGDLIGVRRIGLLWAERVRKKKKSPELEEKEDEELFEKRRNSVEVPICFSEGRRVSTLIIF